MLIKYKPKLTIAENAAENNISVASMRLWLKENHIDKLYDSTYAKFRKVQAVLKKDQEASPQKIAKKTGFSLNTVKKYMKMQEFKRQPRQNMLTTFDIAKESNIIKSVSTDQQEILNNILRLHIRSGVYDADLTFSIGAFYRNDVVMPPSLKYDKYPENAAEGVRPLDEAVELDDESLESVIIDLPFLIIRNKWVKGSHIAKRFNSFDSIDEAKEANTYMLRLAYSKLKNRGILVMKTMDVSFEGKQVWMNRFVQEEAEKIGFKLIDTFILISPTKLLNGGDIQRVSRKYHSYFFVFKKMKRKSNCCILT